MDINAKRQAELKDSRYAELRRASEARVAEIESTIERVRSSAEEHEASVARLASRTDTIELSGAAASVDSVDGGLSAERVAELRSAVEDGTLFDRDRLARAATNILTQ